MFTQIVGKVCLEFCAPVNHWWHTTLRPSARGLIAPPFFKDGTQLQLEFDFINHALVMHCSNGKQTSIALSELTVAQFYSEVMQALSQLGFAVSIWPVPVEVPKPVRFTDNHQGQYDRIYVEHFWTVLRNITQVFEAFRGHFVGKSSPVHFFWGAFDLALTRFSGRANPTPPQDSVMSEAYSHEVISHGFWPGGDWPMGGRVENPVIYAYALPEPTGFAQAPVSPAIAHYHPTSKEFMLPYEELRMLPEPDKALMEFLTSTYEAGANLAGWDRAALERAA